MSVFKFYINNIPINDQPEGWDDFVEQLEFNDEVFGIIPKQPSTLVFTGDGYRLIRQIFQQEGYCSSLDFRADQICGEVLKQGRISGVILITECRFDHVECSCEVEIQDNRWGAKIEINRDLKTSVDSPVSKNGVTITAASAIALTVFNPSTGDGTGLSFGGTREVYDFKEVMTMLVSFMTDGEVGFESDWYDNLPNDEKLCIVRGSQLRNPSSTDGAPEVSFVDMMQAFHKLYNLYFSPVIESGSIVVRLEQLDYFRTNISTVVFADPPKLRSGFETDRLYSGLRIGSEKYYKATFGGFELAYVPFLTHNVEEYIITGECNSADKLDLVGELVYCSNVIEDVLDNGSTDFLDDVFIIQYTPTGVGTGDATKGYYLTEPTVLPALYNEQLLNAFVSERFALSGELAKNFGDDPDGDKFRASRSTDGSVYQDTTDPVQTNTESPVDFDDDFTPPNFDTNGNWSTVTFRYTAPASGFYSFDIHYFWRILSNIPANPFPGNTATENYKGVNIEITITRFDATTAVITSFTSTSQGSSVPNPAPATPHEATFTKGLFLEATDYIEVSVQLQTSTTLTGTGDPPDIQYQPVAGSYIDTLYITTGGGVFDPKDEDLYFIELFELEDYIDEATWEQITENPALGMTIRFDGINYTVFIRDIKRKIIEGELEAALIRNFA